MQINLSPRARRLAKWVGYPLLAIVSFLFALQMTFPYGRLKQKIKDALASKYIVEMQVDRGLMPGTVIFSKVKLTSRQVKPDDKVTTIQIDKITAHLGLFALIGGTASIDFDVKIGGGDISGNVALTSTRTKIDLEIDKVSAEAVPGLADAVGLPMGGRLQGTATFDLPAGDWRQAEADVKLSCAVNCTVGDGVAKIIPKARPGQPQTDGITVPKLLLGQWKAELVMAKAKIDLKTLDVKSDDGEVYVDFHAAVQRSLMDSTVTQGCIKFKGSDALKKREEVFYNGLNITGAPLGPDGYHYLKLAGTLGNIKRLPQVCELGGSGGDSSSTPTVETTGHIPHPPSISPTAPAPVPPAPTPHPAFTPTPSPQPPPPPPGGGPPLGQQPGPAEAIPNGGSGTGAPPPPPEGEGSAAGQGPGTAAGSGAPVEPNAAQGSGSGSAPMN
jgi:type II secretion system protein N